MDTLITSSILLERQTYNASTWNPNSPNFHPSSCTLSTCPFLYAYLMYDPTLWGNALFLAIFGLVLVGQAIIGVRTRTWGVLGVMVTGTTLEILGYTGRIQMHFNPFLKSPFLLYLIPLTIGPVFLAAAIYLCLARIVVVYGEHLSWLKARTYTVLFCCCDFVSLVVQAAGGAKAALAEDRKEIRKGAHIMVAGLSIQVASLLLFMSLTLEFIIRCRSPTAILNPKHSALYSSLKFKAFLTSLSLATICIFTRSVFRVAELSDGFGGKLANDQVSYMILEGAMVIIACVALTVLHPGIGFGREAWKEGDWSLREKKEMDLERDGGNSGGSGKGKEEEVVRSL